eukprot:GHVL01006209.1.p2 GENE.GHVL01006209.1~~GHVL01006209.1.p2  ORF type:complete len:144 (-),score=16.10 GHVL01006209.1:801-1232(-)
MADSGGGECAAGGKKTGKKPAKAQPSEVIPSEKAGVNKSLSIEKSSSGLRDCEVTLKLDNILETMTALSGRLCDLEKVGKLKTPVASTSRGTESHGPKAVRRKSRKRMKKTVLRLDLLMSSLKMSLIWLKTRMLLRTMILTQA